MGFPIPYAGIVPKLLLSAAISMAAIRELCIFFLTSLGLDAYRIFQPSDDLDPIQSHSLPSLSYTAPPSPFVISLQASLPSAPFETILQQTPWRSGQIQCAVCLVEFARGQEVKELPFCAHIFHTECIDGWLRRDNKTCPLCRNSLVREDLAKQERMREQDVVASWFMYFQGDEEEVAEGIEVQEEEEEKH